MLDANIELDNAIVAGHSGMTFGIHICRGNHKSMFYASAATIGLPAQVFKRTPFDRYLLEYDDERSGTFEPLRTCRTIASSCWADQLEGAAARIGGDCRRESRRRRDRAARTAGAQPAVRLCLDPRREPPVAGRSAQRSSGLAVSQGLGLTRGVGVFGGRNWSALELELEWKLKSLSSTHDEARDVAGTQPPLLYPAYKSTVLRAPSKPLIQLPRDFTDLAAPLFGYLPIGEATTT
jgi:hypothetical protein